MAFSLLGPAGPPHGLPRTPTSSFGPIVAKILGTIVLAYGALTALIVGYVFGPGPGLGSGAPWFIIGVALWAYALWRDRPAPDARHSAARQIVQGTGGLGSGPVPPAAGTVPPFDAIAESLYGEVARSSRSVFDGARRMSVTVYRAVAVLYWVVAASQLSIGLTVPYLTPSSAFVAAVFVLLGAIYWWGARWTWEEAARSLDAGRVPDRTLIGAPAGRLVWTRLRRRLGKAPADPEPIELTEPSLLAKSVGMLDFGRRATRAAKTAATVLGFLLVIVGAASAYVAVFLGLVELAGGTSFVARDAGIALAAAALAAMAAFASLRRWTSRIDGWERSLATAERSVEDLERAFWARY